MTWIHDKTNTRGVLISEKNTKFKFLILFYRRFAYYFYILNISISVYISVCCYNPHKHLLKYHLFQTESAINSYSRTYENLIILGDFNVEISDFIIESYCTINNLKCIIKEPTCYKNPDNPTCIYLIIDSRNKHAPLKRNYLRANYSNFKTKELSKAIIERSKLRNIYLKVRSDENRIRYKKEKNICLTA